MKLSDSNLSARVIIAVLAAVIAGAVTLMLIENAHTYAE